MRTIRICVSRTVQVERFEPVQVEIEEIIQIKDTEDPTSARKQLYKDVTQQVKSCIDNEVRKYKKARADEGDEE